MPASISRLNSVQRRDCPPDSAGAGAGAGAGAAGAGAGGAFGSVDAGGALVPAGAAGEDGVDAVLPGSAGAGAAAGVGASTTSFTAGSATGIVFSPPPTAASTWI